MTMTQALRKAIRESGKTTYRIALDTDLSRLSIDRFLRGERSMRLDKADALAAYFGLELQPAKRTRKG